MIDFRLNDDQLLLQRTVHEFAAKEMRSIAQQCDEEEQLPEQFWRAAAGAGLTSFSIPEEYGGGGVTDAMSLAIVREELAWGCAGMNTSLGANLLTAAPIMSLGTEAQKKRWLPEFCVTAPPKKAAFALTEPNGGSDVASMQSSARRQGHEWIINAHKCLITNGGIADIYVVFARTDPERGVHGISAFVVDGRTPGIIAGRKEKKMGLRCSHTGEVVFRDVRVPQEQLLGQEGSGFIGAMRSLDRTRPTIGGSATGLARAALEYAAAYASQRIAFGKPIIEHQAVGQMLAQMAIEIDAARLLTWRACDLANRGVTMTKEASMAKVFASDVAMRATTNAVQILGGHGYLRDHPVEKWMRDAKVFQIFEGTNEILRNVVARQLVRELAPA